jgi:hypothetical protein
MHFEHIMNTKFISASMLPTTAHLRSLPGNNLISQSTCHVNLAAPLLHSPSAIKTNLQACKASTSKLLLTDDGFVDAGPRDSQPDYSAIDAQPIHRLMYSLFRNKMAQALRGKDSPMEGYPAIIDLTRRLNALGSPQDTQKATRKILNSLFPSWLPGAFKVKNNVYKRTSTKKTLLYLPSYIIIYIHLYKFLILCSDVVFKPVA